MDTAAPDAPSYKVVEIVDVTDVTIEEALNRWSGKGYRMESVQFVTQTGSRRPSMAFLVFVRRCAGTGA